MAREDLLIEIGTEELPAGFIPRALDMLKALLEKDITSARLGFVGISTFGTPRRLVLLVKGLETVQPDADVEARGPKREAAFDKDGKPTKALLGFCKGQGVEPSEVETIETDKGAYVLVKKRVKGEKALTILPGLLAGAISSELFPRSMRWGEGVVSFGRPMHWLLVLLGAKPVNVSFGHIESGTVSYGHRFMGAADNGRAKALEVKSAGDYFDSLKDAHVIVDPEERKEIIRKGLNDAAREAGGELLPDDELVDEVANLVEFPVVLRGSFEEEFLSLPPEVVINAMREHQRYFSVADEDGNLLPNFLTVANTDVKDREVVVRGNERVLRARLNDAKFYFDQDVKVSLDERVEELKGVVFQRKLGTSYEKVERFAKIAEHIGELAGYPDLEKLKRAAMLSKADLVSGMVGEFPKLQGLMGSMYAAMAGEAEEVQVAIREHYMPVAAGAELPSTDAGAIISIADKMDTIAGCFSVGLIPTGAKDPYALRRAALGIIAIIESKINFSLTALICFAIEGVEEKRTREKDDVQRDVVEFFRERFKNQLMSRGFSFDAIDAVLSEDTSDWRENLSDDADRIKALEVFKKNPDCTRLTVAFKRVSNILKSAAGDYRPGPPVPENFTDPHERALFDIKEQIAPEIKACERVHDYEGALKKLTSIKETIDTFFDEVMVMVDDKEVRGNRLCLLHSVRELYANIADLSKLAVVEG